MNHSFNVNIAEEYGLEEAILLDGIFFWCWHNWTNQKNIREGRAWTYNSVSAFHQQYSYISPAKIARALRNLEDDGFIVSAMFSGYDRTKWYALTDKAEELYGRRCSGEPPVPPETTNPSGGRNVGKRKDVSSQRTGTKAAVPVSATMTSRQQVVKQPGKDTRRLVPLSDREPVNDIECVEKKYLENYRKLHERGEVRTDAPVINWGQSRKLTRAVIDRHGLENVLFAVERSMEDDFCIRNGYSLSMILSAGVFSGLLNGSGRNRKHHFIDDVDHPEDMGNILF